MIAALASFWLMIIWTPPDGVPYVLHLAYPSEDQCKSDGEEIAKRDHDNFTCEEFEAPLPGMTP